MFLYWSAVLRRVSVPGLALGAILGVGMATVDLVDGLGWRQAASGAVTCLLLGYLVFALFVSTSETVLAQRVARSHGGVPDAAMFRFPCAREVRLPRKHSATAAALANEVLGHARATNAVRIEQVLERGGGDVYLIAVGGAGARVAAHLDAVVEGEEVVVRIKARPLRCWKQLDGGASWGVARALESCARATLRERGLQRS
ncbi:hypothetical protein [Streptomyces alkaliterrae]|uniref:Uncharacterized protein n=1 Tax=Streptomyces alkaliterrae TaxID=2213162 RepID=A0A5P0YYF7_9ACTN|nr:hypothetical protein [Streptomyces alkaliterrae]MBB1262344.1 hypothetical protein [Streptomyces alkaliterrae]MQS05318.1 hypothetical protein [Streptomyces alkaliterrae]